MATRVIKSQFYGKCHACGGVVQEGERVNYDATAPRGKKISHLDCENSQELVQQRKTAALIMSNYETAERQLAEFGNVPEGTRVRLLESVYHEAFSDLDYSYRVGAGSIGVITRAIVGDASTSYHGVKWEITCEFGSVVTVWPHASAVQVIS